MANFTNVKIDSVTYQVYDATALHSLPDGVMLDVKNFGAVGDGSHDDTTAINNALSTSKNAFLPAGVYLVTSPILLPDGCTLTGAGRGQTIIRAKANSFSGTHVVKSSKFDTLYKVNNGDGDAGFHTLSNITIDGNAWSPYESVIANESVPNYATVCSGLGLVGSCNVLQNIAILNCNGSNLMIDNSQSYNWDHPFNGVSRYENIDVGLCSNHAVILTGAQNTDSTFVNMHVANGSCTHNGTYHNILIEEGANANFVNCHFASQYGYRKCGRSVQIEPTATSSRFLNCDIEGAFNNNMYLGSSGNIFTNCRFYAAFGPSATNVLLGNSASRNIFQACSFGPPANDNIFTGALTGDVSADGGGFVGSMKGNVLVNCFSTLSASNNTFAYFNSQWANTVVDLVTDAPGGNPVTFEQPSSNRCRITGANNYLLNWATNS